MNRIIHHHEQDQLQPGETYVYCGRGTLWGNPHPTGRHCRSCGYTHSRDGAIEAFRTDWYSDSLVAQVRRERALRDLPGKVLGCWCKSRRFPHTPCHVDIIAEFLSAQRPPAAA